MKKMNIGKNFENQFQRSCKKQGVFCLKLKDKSSYIKSSPDSNVSKNICDFIVHHKKHMFALELKTTEGTSISFNQPPYEKTDKSVKILPNQIAGLMEVNRHDINAGLIINFRERETTRTKRDNCCFYIPIEKFIEFCEQDITNKSISVDKCKEIGYNINFKKLRVNSEYYIKELIENLIENGA